VGLQVWVAQGVGKLVLVLKRARVDVVEASS
jgi:hypothetical protein